MLPNRLFSLLGALAAVPLLASAASLDSTSTLEPRGSTKCWKGVKVIAARGDGTKPPKAFGKLITLAHNITGAIPKSHSIGTPYDPGNGTGYVAPSADGIPKLTAEIADYFENCPDSKMVLAGYSLGAVIMMNTLCGTYGMFTPETPPLDPKYIANIVGIIIYGDESRVAGESYNQGSCTTGSGQIARTNADACSPYAPLIKSYCVLDDPLCCQPSNPNSNESYHFVYPDDYDVKATKWIVKQFEAATNTTVSSS